MPYLPADPPLTGRDLFGITRRPDAGGPTGWLPRQTAFFGSGRAALRSALIRLKVGRGDEVLLPSYLCESVVSPVFAQGARPAFYPVDRSLQPDLGVLATSVGPRTRAVVVIHYLGFPGPVEEVRRLCDRRGLLLIEDCAHALFSGLGHRLLGSFGDAAIFSPWKSLPLPDGGLLAVNRRYLSPEAMPVDPASFSPPTPPRWTETAGRLIYRSAGALESAVGWSPRLWLLRRPGLRKGLHDRTSGAPVRMERGSWIARKLLHSAPAGRIVARRRHNYRRLLDAAEHLTWARPVFDRLPDGVCPLGLPLVAEDRNRWRDELLAVGVNVRTYWEHLPEEVPLDRFPDAAWLRDRLLVLPVHQGLREDQVDWLARRLPRLGGRGRPSTRDRHAARADR